MHAAVYPTELNCRSSRYPGTYNPDAYTRLVLEALRGNQSTFVRNDEVCVLKWWIWYNFNVLCIFFRWCSWKQHGEYSIHCWPRSKNTALRQQVLPPLTRIRSLCIRTCTDLAGHRNPWKFCSPSGLLAMPIMSGIMVQALPKPINRNQKGLTVYVPILQTK
jgi:hypothetical protein